VVSAGIPCVICLDRMPIRTDVRATPAGTPANEPCSKSLSRPSSGHRSPLIAMRAMIVATIDQQPANAGRAQLGEGDLLAEEGGGHAAIEAASTQTLKLKMRKCVPPEQTLSRVGHLAMFYREKSNASKLAGDPSRIRTCPANHGLEIRYSRKTGS